VLLLAYKVFTSGIAIDFGSMLGVLMLWLCLLFFVITDDIGKERNNKQIVTLEQRLLAWYGLCAVWSGLALLIWKYCTSGIAIDFWSVLGVLLIFLMLISFVFLVPEEKGKRPNEHQE
jgi:hypothetical protein